jgi:hypothetical protein
MNEPQSKTPRWVRVLVGVFVVWQLVFLMTVNLTNFLEEEGRLKDRQSRSVNLMLNVQRLMHFWSDSTLQREYWGLFREIPKQSRFPAVELAWREPQQGEPTLLLRSFEEPDNPGNFLMLNPLTDRLHNHEVSLELIFDAWETRAAIVEPDQREKALAELIRVWYRPLWAYMQRRIEQHRLSHPNMPAPTEAILLWRVYPALAPGEDGPPKGPIRREVVRWRASRPVDPESIPLEVYDPQGNRYIEVIPQR